MTTLVERLRSVLSKTSLSDRNEAADEIELLTAENENIRLKYVDAAVEVGKLKTELKAIDKALDDPCTDLTHTMVEVIQSIKTELAEAKKREHELFGGTKRDLATKLKQQVDKNARLVKELAALKAQAEPELLFDGKTSFEFVANELYEFQNATGCDTADEFKAQSKPVAVAGELWSIAMNAAAYLEDAAIGMHDCDGKKDALGAAKWVRDSIKNMPHTAPADKDAERYRWHVKLYAKRMGVLEEDIVKELDAAIAKEGK